MKKNRFIKELDQPLMHADHKRPMTRRDFVSQGFAFGTGVALGGSLLGLASSSANAITDQDIRDQLQACGAFDPDNAKIPFICFDLAGGANFAGSSVLVGGPGGQEDFLDTSGYQRLGLPVDQTPNLDSAANPLIDDSFGLKFHADSPFLRGLREFAPEAAANTNGAVLPARSENDTGNNPHNPMYAVNLAGANGGLLSLVGSRTSDSGGNSMAPMAYMDPGVRPTKIDSSNDARGLVDTGDLARLLGSVDTGAVMESVYRLSNAKLGRVTANITSDMVAKDLVRCGYAKAASNAEQTPDGVDPSLDPDIVDFESGNDAGVFTQEEYGRDREFRKTAAIMKLVIDGHAGAGTVTMGGYDYHGGRRARGEGRDLRAGRCIGAALDYARRKEQQLMIYVFSDGSLSSNGMIDNQAGDGLVGRASEQPGGRGKGEWVSDNQQTACTWFLVYNPPSMGGRARLRGGSPDEQAQHQQLGHFRSSGNVETGAKPFANNVDLLVDAITLNYMALHGEEGAFGSTFTNSPLNFSDIDSLIAFQSIR
ncbi:MAG: hypothetical protein ACJATK_002412 [Paracoccaceae bacterium]|jgi:hypothetical protein